MKISSCKLRYPYAFILLVLGLLTAGCSSGQEPTPPPDTQTITLKSVDSGATVEVEVTVTNTEISMEVPSGADSATVVTQDKSGQTSVPVTVPPNQGPATTPISPNTTKAVFGASYPVGDGTSALFVGTYNVLWK